MFQASELCSRLKGFSALIIGVGAGPPTSVSSYLCVFEGVHDEDGEAQSEDVGQETGVEICPAVLL